MNMPTGAVDVHAHVLDPLRPVAPGAAYSLFPATLGDYERHLANLGIEAGVLVTASAHGKDNQPMMDALASGTSLSLRGVAVVGTDVTDSELDTMHKCGVRGIRLQDKFPGGTPLSAIGELGARLADWGWHLEILTNFAEHLDWLPHAITSCPVPVVLDHFGYMPSQITEDTPAIATMIGLARDHGTWITLSGAYRLAPNHSPAEADSLLEPRVRLFTETVADRLLWASDWPYVAPPREEPEAGQLLHQIQRWLPDPELRRQVLVANPRECYGFDELVPAAPPAELP
ncbi:UNVERIFIED_ORG: putative TIM-barrel fold metal-dependent hydrolase [Arthrobacter globiformis]|nr:putative TIM-barrel fold metal-dependent hydrolase [Arthrobacter globiformis]